MPTPTSTRHSRESHEPWPRPLARSRPLLLDQRRRYAQQIDLRRRCCRRQRSSQRSRTSPRTSVSREVASPPVHDSASAMPPSARAEQAAHDFLQRLAITAEEIVGQDSSDLVDCGVERCRNRWLVGAARREMQLDLTWRCENRGFDWYLPDRAIGYTPAASAPRRVTRCARQSEARAARVECRRRWASVDRP